MTHVAAIHVPEKNGLRLAFIDDFGGCRKRHRIIQPVDGSATAS
jgi:hypothetical protein